MAGRCSRGCRPSKARSKRWSSEIEGRPVHVAGSGRTDAGVHALAQVAAFSIENPIPCENLRKAMNRLLPRSIRIRAVEEVAARVPSALRREGEDVRVSDLSRGDLPAVRAAVCASSSVSARMKSAMQRAGGAA